MVNLSLLLHSLQHTPPITDSAMDIAFHTIVSLMEAEDYAAATPLLEAEIRRGAFDVRLIAYFFFLHSHAKGLASLEETLPLWYRVITEYGELLSPRSKIEQHIEKSLLWFVTGIFRHCEYIDKQRHKNELKPLQTYLQGATPQVVAQVLAHLQKLHGHIMQRWETSVLPDKLMRLRKQIQDFSRLGCQEEPEQESSPEPIPMVVGPAPEAPAVVYQAPLSPAPVQATNSPTPDAPWLALLQSEPFMLFIHKLDAFRVLLHQKEYKKASLVADDISHTIANFNPLLYFPKLLAEYFSLSAAHVSELDDPQWKNTTLYQLLHNLYKTDIATFIQWKP